MRTHPASRLWIGTTIALFAMAGPFAPTVSAQGPPFSFQPARNLPTGRPLSEQPDSIVIGDFDRDGLADVAVANASGIGDSTVTVFLNGGGGTFPSPRSFPAGFNPHSIAAADFDGDGTLDLAVTNNGPTVSVLLGDGAGNFAAPTPFAVPQANLIALAAADLNGDGRQDLVVASLDIRTSNGGLNLHVLLGNGLGGFGAPGAFPAGDSPISIAVADFDRDGQPDLAIANFNGANSPTGNTVSVHLGNGAGGFPTMTEYPVGRNPLGVAVGDLNGDGFLDLVVANSGGGTPGQGSVSVLLGDGSGGFGPTRDFVITSGQPSAVAFGDLNGDGLPDVVVSRTAGPADVLVFPGDGAGGLGQATSFAVDTAPQAVAVADFDVDGRRDIATANALGVDVSILLGAGAGSPVAVPTLGLVPLLALVAGLGTAGLLALRRARAGP